MSDHYTNSQKDEILQGLKLGKVSEYSSVYNPELLESVPRSLSRDELGISNRQPFTGCDVWHAYELSWLNKKGKPVVALARCIVPFDTPNLVESKSFKLYLNSFNQTNFESQIAVHQLLEQDLTKITGGQVLVELFEPDAQNALPVSSLPGDCIDHLDIEVEEYNFNPSFLKSNHKDLVQETLHSHLLKSNCLITNQPDWASVVIGYQGPKVDQEGLLRYLISFRQHNEFHEQCVERIFIDLMKTCKLEKLSVQALYTRRGGLDINPFRASDEFSQPPNLRINRQ